MVTQYTFQNILAVEKYNRYKLPLSIINILDEYTKLVSSPSYIKSPHFLMKRSIILDNNRNNIQNIQDTIKKILNKITEKNYDKLILELTSNFKFLIDNTNISDSSDNVENTIKNTVELIFNNFFSSTINVDLNIKIVNSLITTSQYVQDYLDNFIEKCNKLEEDVEVCTSISFEEIDRINKKNNIVKNKIIFLCRLEKIEKIEKSKINNLIINYQNLFINMLNQSYAKMECDEIAEIILIFLNEKKELDINNKNESIIIQNIKDIIDKNIVINNNLSTKIILKHKNLLEKLNL